MAEFLGREGILTYATVVIGNVKMIDYGVSRPKIDKTVKGDRHQKNRVGLPERALTFSTNLDYVTAQKSLIDFLETATPDESEGTLVFTVATGKTWTWTSGAVFLGAKITSPEGNGLTTMEGEFALNVPATISWV